MSKLICTKVEVIYGRETVVKVYSQNRSIDNLSLTKKYYAKQKGVSGGMLIARERNLKTNNKKEV